MAVHQPIKEERQASEPRTTKATYTKRRTSRYYLNSSTRPNQAHCIQSTLRQVQGRPPHTPEARASHKQCQQLHRSIDIGRLPSTHQRPQHGTQTASSTQEYTYPYHLRLKA